MILFEALFGIMAQSLEPRRRSGLPWVVSLLTWVRSGNAVPVLVRRVERIRNVSLGRLNENLLVLLRYGVARLRRPSPVRNLDAPPRWCLNS